MATNLPTLHSYTSQLITDKKLTPTAKQVGQLIAHGTKTRSGFCLYTLEQLAEYTGRCVRSVKSAIRCLEDCKYVKVDRKYRNNRYLPNFDSCKNHRGKTSHPTEEKDALLRRPPSQKKRKAAAGTGPARSNGSRSPSAFSSPEEAKRKIYTYRAFKNHVYRTWRSAVHRQEIPSGWLRPARHFDQWAFRRSVNTFVEYVGECDSHLWKGFGFLLFRLKRWLENERVKRQCFGGGLFNFAIKDEVEDEMTPAY